VSASVAEAMPRAARWTSDSWAGLAFAAFAHAVVLGLAARDARAAAFEEDERATTLRGLLASAEVRARANEMLQDGAGKDESRRVNDRPGDGREGGGVKAAGAVGKMGDRRARPEGAGHFAIPAFDNRAAPSASRAEVLADATQFGMIGLLGQGPATPVAPF